MGKFFSWIFGSSENARVIVEGGKNLLDKAVYTKQEKADNGKWLLSWYLDFLRATNPQNVVRRFLAVVIFTVWLFLILLMAGLHVFGSVGNAEYLYNLLKDIMAKPVSYIIVFYFGVQILRDGGTALGKVIDSKNGKK